MDSEKHVSDESTWKERPAGRVKVLVREVAVESSAEIDCCGSWYLRKELVGACPRVCYYVLHPSGYRDLWDVDEESRPQDGLPPSPKSDRERIGVLKRTGAPASAGCASSFWGRGQEPIAPRGPGRRQLEQAGFGIFS